jgi:hypothetical protein
MTEPYVSAKSVINSKYLISAPSYFSGSANLTAPIHIYRVLLKCVTKF